MCKLLANTVPFYMRLEHQQMLTSMRQRLLEIQKDEKNKFLTACEVMSSLRSQVDRLKMCTANRNDNRLRGTYAALKRLRQEGSKSKSNLHYITRLYKNKYIEILVNVGQHAKL